MTKLTAEAIQALTSFKAAGAPVLTVYLDVDGRRWPRWIDCETRAELLLRAAGNGKAGDDVARIVGVIRGGLDRSHTRGLALFSSGEALWQTFELPVAVRDQVVVNETPHVGQLESAWENHESFGVLLADRQRARMFVFTFGELVDVSEQFDALPRHDDDAGNKDRGRGPDHVVEMAHQHLKRAAALAFAAYQRYEFDHLIVGAPTDVRPLLEKELHRYLRDRLTAHVNVAPGAGAAEVVAAALEVEDRVERDKQAALVVRVRERLHPGGGRGAGCAGLEEVLSALSERRVERLVLSDGYEAPGWHCDGCGRLCLKGRRCSVCGDAMRPIDDVVEEALEEALRQSCRVDVCVANADLDVMGRIAALLRY